jgi:3-methylcrotonyl-CoA carboxylase alpha subunit
MEMNTRLQVEHPVTEMVTGIDLVEWQLRVAAGEELPLGQEQITLSGHAFEARIYAEDPAKNFLPATGTLHHLKFPEGVEGAAIRVETGVEAGDTISPYYDPMIAKLVVHAGDRATALDALAQALSHTEIAGSTVNTAFLTALARDPDFASGDVDTGLIGRQQEELTRSRAPASGAVAAAALSAAGIERRRSADPWDSLAGFTHFTPMVRRVRLSRGEETIVAGITAREDGRFRVEVEGQPAVTLALPKGGVSESGLRLAEWPGHITVFDGPAAMNFRIADPLEEADDAAGGSDSLRAPMPGLVKLVRAEAGDKVRKGQPLIILEAMKMEHTIAAPHDGVVAEVANEGAQVSEGVVLVRFEAD